MALGKIKFAICLQYSAGTQTWEDEKQAKWPQEGLPSACSKHTSLPEEFSGWEW